MASRSISTSLISGGYDVATSQGIIDTLKVNMASGKIIYAADVNALINLWNAFNGHTHGIQDLWGLKSFGNTNPGYNYYLGYWYLSWAYRVQSGGLWGQVNWTVYNSGTFTGPDGASVQAQYDALPATMTVSGTDEYGQPYSFTVPKSITGGPAPAYGFAYYATSPGNYDNRVSDGPNLAGDIALIGQGEAVSAAKINELVSALSTKGNHNHTWYDRTGP